MTYTLTIGIGMVITTLLFTGIVYGVAMGPSAIDEQNAIAKEYVEVNSMDSRMFMSVSHSLWWDR